MFNNKMTIEKIIVNIVAQNPSCGMNHNCTIKEIEKIDVRIIVMIVFTLLFGNFKLIIDAKYEIPVTAPPIISPPKLINKTIIIIFQNQ